MSQSTHRVDVTRVHLHTHPNADTLSIATLDCLPGYQVVVRTSDWQDGQLGAYVQPDSLVPLADPRFAFLQRGEGETQHRVRVVKLRGQLSHGLLTPAPEGAAEGDDVAEQLGVLHYDPEIAAATHGGQEKAPASLFAGVYDVESFHRYAHLVFIPGEPCIVTEKIHGSNARYQWHEGRLWVGSHKQWKIDIGDASPWWQMTRLHPGLVDLLQDFPGHTLYGEVYGFQKGMKYGRTQGAWDLAIFDLRCASGVWLDVPSLISLCAAYDVPTVPVLPPFFFDFDALLALANGPSLVPGADHHREGIVVKPKREREHPALGRVCLKIVSDTYHLAKGA
jgi:RNA ligase (TIGR02306 family)